MDVNVLTILSKNATHEYRISIPFTIEPVDKVFPTSLNDGVIDPYLVEGLALSIRGSKQNDIHDTIKDAFRPGNGIAV
jgi:hypothetical protein